MNVWIHAEDRGSKIGQVEGKGRGTERLIQSKKDGMGKRHRKQDSKTQTD